MIVTPGVQKYEVVLQDKYFLRECIQKLSLEERLDEIAYCAKMTLAVPGDQFTGLPIIKPGMKIRVSGTRFGESRFTYLIEPGVVWDVEIANKARRNWNLTVYDRLIYLAKSKDEYLWSEGQTATDRINKICTDWKIPISNIPAIEQKLAAATVRAKPIWGIIQDTLKETASKSGRLFTVRMQPDGLEIFELGTNKDVWIFEFGANLETVSQKQTLSGAVTKVKILGKASKGKRTPVSSTATAKKKRKKTPEEKAAEKEARAAASKTKKNEPSVVIDTMESADVDELGTIQEIYSDQKAIDAGTASAKAASMLTGIQETVKVEAIDINTIRKGDKVIVEGWESGLYVMSVRHELGTPGKMQMELSTLDYIRRKYYHER